MAADNTVARAEALLAAGARQEAIALVDGAAAAGNVDALMRLATWRLIGAPVPRDLPLARALLARTVAIGHVDAALMQIALTANGSGGVANWPAALALLRIAARNDPLAAEHLALVGAMDIDTDGMPRNIPEPERLSDAPDLVRYRALLTPQECAHIAGIAADMLEPASVLDPTTGAPIAHPVRTSYGAVIGPAKESLPTRALNHRLAAISGTMIAQGEPLAVLRYTPGQQYRPHLDSIAGAINQRIKTVLVYLNHGFVGGETRFMATGLTIAPQPGDAIVFSNVLENGQPDRSAEHAGLPVTRGAKWLATRWIRATPYDAWNAPRL
ncbi:prolyl hydroxylase family protein [Sphingomonas hylomeconis]|uniref:2OG-Fe(II) oxygenase n=1 Tax=Sphingomonas hylomeconis TaxID=1395958 RepID=A0ABV7SWL7_9SPHN|nr:2OG-Fe(II) oxygenase [Sphingomonas hylomeconis]